MLLSRLLGAGAGADAFFVAFKLPNIFRRLFAEAAQKRLIPDVQVEFSA